MVLEQIKNILADRVVTYLCESGHGFLIVKRGFKRVRITARGNLIVYPDELITRTADLTVSKILWNSVLSTEDTTYASLDVAYFYLGKQLDRYL